LRVFPAAFFLDQAKCCAYISRLNRAAGNTMSEPLLAQVEAKLDELLLRYHQLLNENQNLRQRESAWLSERDQLLEKQQLARSRIESLIARLQQHEIDPE
jgi:cell division protein ZapB